MNLQFITGNNPNKPEQGTFIYHAAQPRFLALVEGDSLRVIDNIDNADLEGKLKRAHDWYISTKKKNDAHAG